MYLEGSFTSTTHRIHCLNFSDLFTFRRLNGPLSVLADTLSSGVCIAGHSLLTGVCKEDWTTRHVTKWRGQGHVNNNTWAKVNKNK